MYVIAAQLAHADRVRGEGGFHLLFPLLLLLLTAVIIFTVIRRRRGHVFSHGHQFQMSAISVLEERFARGEIDQGDFAHRRAVLEGQDQASPTPPASDAPEGDDSADEQG